MNAYIVTGTDTDIGKTVCAALLTLALGAYYWKPVQSGLAGETDREAVQRMTGLPDSRLLPEAYKLREPLSPHRAAELDGVEIDQQALRNGLPAQRPLIVEGAGGLMVPLTRQYLNIDLFRDLGLPVILCARTGLGTINHTLLSVAALKQAGILLHGIVFIGEENTDNMATIIALSESRQLGHIPRLPVLDAGSLEQVFETGFDKKAFAA